MRTSCKCPEELLLLADLDICVALFCGAFEPTDPEPDLVRPQKGIHPSIHPSIHVLATAVSPAPHET